MEKKYLGMNIFELIGFITSFLYYLTPMLLVFNPYRQLINKIYLSYFGLGALYLNGLLFFFYSLANIDSSQNYPTLEFCNLVGAILGFFFSLKYINLVYKDDTKQILLLLLIFGSLILILVEYLIIDFCVKNKYNVIKNIIFYSISCINVLMYFPIGFNIRKIISDKIPEKIILYSSTIGLLNCIIWIIFSIHNKYYEEGNSVHIIISNSISAIICIVQIILFFSFLKNNKNIYYEDELNKFLDSKEKNEKEKNDSFSSSNIIPEFFEKII